MVLLKNEIQIKAYLAPALTLFEFLLFSPLFQEADSTKTNNGIQYRLQLLYANGECDYFILFLQLNTFSKWLEYRI